MGTIVDFVQHGLGAGDVALTALRVGTGAFFAASGFNKLFNAGRHASLVRTLEADRVPLVRINQWWVPINEFGGGCALALGIASGFFASVLLVLIGVALLCEARKRIAAFKPINWEDCVADFLYLPETLYALALLVLVLAGPGAFTLF